MNKTIFEGKQIKCLYDEELKILTSIYSGVMNMDAAIKHFGQVEAFSKTNTISGIIGDLRKLRGSFARTLDHFENTGYPLLIRNGLKAEALIVSDDIITKHLAEKLRELLIKLGMQCEIFSTIEESEPWILNAMEKGP